MQINPFENEKLVAARKSESLLMQLSIVGFFLLLIVGGFFGRPLLEKFFLAREMEKAKGGFEIRFDPSTLSMEEKMDEQYLHQREQERIYHEAQMKRFRPIPFESENIDLSSSTNVNRSPKE